MPDLKLCECGCGQPAPIAWRNDSYRGLVKGQHMRFRKGHNGRKPGLWPRPCKCGCGALVMYRRFLPGHRAAFPIGVWNTPEGRAWRNARQRCTNPNFPQYSDYGGRGIEFRFTAFKQFFAEIGPRPTPAHTLDRKDNDGHYEPGNVRWATRKEQRVNERPKRKVA